MGQLMFQLLVVSLAMVAGAGQALAEKRVSPVIGNLVFLDACRDNPLARGMAPRSAAVGGGLARVGTRIARLEGQKQVQATPPKKAMPADNGAKAPAQARGARLGVYIQEVTEDVAKSLGMDAPKGAHVAKVLDDSAAAAAGIKAGDVILHFNGKPVPKRRDLPRMVYWNEPGSPFSVTVRRKSADVTLTGHLKKLEPDRILENERKASKGHPQAMYELGEGYYFGIHYEPDAKVALTWLERAAGQGNGDAMVFLGRHYESAGDGAGNGPARDLAKAVSWYRTAMEAGHLEGLYRLALLHKKGEGVPKDHMETIRLLRKAAESGHTLSMAQLGSEYETEGRDRIAAADWYLRAAESKDAILKLDVSRTLKLALGLAAKLDEDGNGKAVAEILMRAAQLRNSPARSALLNGLKGGSVATRKAVQQRLKDAGRYKGKVDGGFGPDTKRAIEALIAPFR